MKIRILLGVVLLAAAPLRAEPQVFESGETRCSLIELFTSEGCSSCPPAEAWVSGLRADAGLWKGFVPVVFHVDYWDNLGWPDRFAEREFTERQRRYAAAWGGDSVYTPGFVLTGGVWGEGGGGAGRAGGGGRSGVLRVTLRDAGHAEVSFTAGTDGVKPTQVEVALLGGGVVSDVLRGENKGRKLRHDFIVVGLAKGALAPVAGDGRRFTAVVALPEKTVVAPVAVAAWVSSGDGTGVVQATGGWVAR